MHTTQINAATARGARPHRQSADEHAPNAAHAHRARRRPAALACAGSMHAAARGPADRPDSLPCQQGSAEHLPAGLVRVTLLHSGATRTACMRTLVSASPSLDTHPHCYHSCIIHTHHSCARPAASTLTHKNVPHLSKGSLQLAPALRAPPPKGVLFQSPAAASARTPGTPAARASQALSAGAYACRPPPLLLSATPTTTPDTTRYQPHSRFLFRVTSSGPPRILLTTSCLAPAGAAPANTPPRQLMPCAVWPHARLSLGAATWRASRAWLTLQARSWACGALEEEEACRGHPVLTIGIAHHIP